MLGVNIQLIKAFISLTQISFLFQKEQQVSQTYRKSEIHNIYVGLEIKKNSWKYRVDRQQKMMCFFFKVMVEKRRIRKNKKPGNFEYSYNFDFGKPNRK